jgi:hypothetical protein
VNWVGKLLEGAVHVGRLAYCFPFFPCWPGLPYGDPRQDAEIAGDPGDAVRGVANARLRV